MPKVDRKPKWNQWGSAMNIRVRNNNSIEADKGGNATVTKHDIGSTCEAPIQNCSTKKEGRRKTSIRPTEASAKTRTIWTAEVAFSRERRSGQQQKDQSDPEGPAKEEKMAVLVRNNSFRISEASRFELYGNAGELLKSYSSSAGGNTKG